MIDNKKILTENQNLAEIKTRELVNINCRLDFQSSFKKINIFSKMMNSITKNVTIHYNKNMIFDDLNLLKNIISKIPHLSLSVKPLNETIETLNGNNIVQFEKI